MIYRVTKNVLEMDHKSRVRLMGCSAAGVMAQWYSELDDAKPKRSWIAKDIFPCAACCNNFKPSDVEVEEAAIE